MVSHADAIKFLQKKETIKANLRFEAAKIRKLEWRGKVPEHVTIFPKELSLNPDFKFFCDTTFVDIKNWEIKDPFEIIKIPVNTRKPREEVILKKHIKGIEFFKEYHDIIVD